MDILFNPGMGGYLRHLHLGWGGSKKDPHLTQKLRGLERQEKNNRKLIKKTQLKLFVIFCYGLNCGLQGPKMSRISSFSRLLNIASENLNYLRNC